MTITRRTFLSVAGTIVAATVVDPIGKVASFLDPSERFYVAQILVDSSVYLMHSLEHLAVGDFVVSNGNGFVRRQRTEAEVVIGVALAMQEVTR